ncbi:uncharacterized protein METZ01_LOCUS228621 [marine metagenome]|uniref:Uncharacterized protein n=1 Tax=marine metagenome TaxID=408172 RepID=A0A382GM97_9ZZZZ
MLVELCPGYRHRYVGNNWASVHLFSCQMDHGARLGRSGLDQFPDNFLPSAGGPVGKCGMEVQQRILAAHLSANNQHVTGQHADVGFLAGQLVHYLLVELLTVLREPAPNPLVECR